MPTYHAPSSLFDLEGHKKKKKRQNPKCVQMLSSHVVFQPANQNLEMQIKV